MSEEKDSEQTPDNGQILRDLIEASGLSQQMALDEYNKRQARPYSLGQWKAFLAKPDSARRSPCPDSVIKRARAIFKPAA